MKGATTLSSLPTLPLFQHTAVGHLSDERLLFVPPLLMHPRHTKKKALDDAMSVVKHQVQNVART